MFFFIKVPSMSQFYFFMEEELKRFKSTDESVLLNLQV